MGVLSVGFLLFQIKYCLAELKILMRRQVREKLGIDAGSGVTVSDVETR